MENSNNTIDREDACRIISENKLQIDNLINDCVKISEKSGVPFKIYLEGVYNTYIPKNAKSEVIKDGDYEDAVFLDESGEEIYDDGYASLGYWQTSQMC